MAYRHTGGFEPTTYDLQCKALRLSHTYSPSPSSPVCDALGALEKASMVGLLQSLISLGDEGRRPIDALLTVGDLLGQFP